MKLTTKRLALTVKLLFTIILCWLVLRNVDLAPVFSGLVAADPGYTLLCLLVSVPTVLLSAFRWKMLACGLIDLVTCIKYTLIGMFYAALLPGSTSGDIGRGVALAAKSPTTRHISLPASILADRLIGLAALGFVAAAGFALVAVHPIHNFAETELTAPAASLAAGLGIALAALAILPLSPMFTRLSRHLLLLARHTRLHAAISGATDALAVFAETPGLITRAFVVSLVIHAVTALGYWLAFRAFGLAADLITATVFYCGLSLVLLLPISISGIGVREVFSIFFFRILDATPEQAVAFSWFLLALGLFVALLGGAVQAFELDRRKHTGETS